MPISRPEQPVFRFAPSPNGLLHLGHALSAILNHDMAESMGGRFLLRIEDIDRTRCRPEFEAAIFEDLAWLGLDWEEPVRRQSEHLGVYAAALATTRGRRIAAVGAGLAVGGLIAASRVILNVHYLADVLAGACLGLSWLCACLVVDAWLRSRRARASGP